MSPRPRRWPVSLGALAFALALPASAWAQPVAFEEHLRRGVELRRAGHDVESIAEFEEARRLSREPRVAAQLGLACQAVGRWLEADRLLHEALGAPDDAWVARNRAALEGALAVVAGHIGRIEVYGDVPGAEVRVDGDLVATLPMREPVPVLAGVVTLTVTAPGHEPITRRFPVEPGALVREAVTLRLLPAPAAAPIAAAVTTPVTTPVLPPRPSSTRVVLGVASLAGAGLALGLGGVALGLREAVATDYNRHTPPCPVPPAVSGTSCGDLEDAATAWRTTAIVSFTVGAALAATGALLLLLPQRREGRAAVVCAPDAIGAGVSCAGRF